MILDIEQKLEGIIEIQIIKEDGTLKEGDGLNTQFKNLITDVGLNSLGTDGSITSKPNYCAVGTGNTTPSVSDTSLVSATGSRSAIKSALQSGVANITTPPYTTMSQWQYTFTVGAVSGNLSEIGFFSASTGGTMWSRSLVKDSNGNPTTITVLATEQLVVKYSVYLYLPSSTSGTFVLTTNRTPTTIDYTITPSNVGLVGSYWSNFNIWNAYGHVFETQTLGAITSRPSGTAAAANTMSGQTYTSGNFYINYTFNYNISTANFSTGIGSIVFGAGTNSGSTYCGFQVSFSPKIMKTSAQTLSITVRYSWGRA